MEAGDDKESKSSNIPNNSPINRNKAEENTFVMGETLKMMKAKTGKESFTLLEMQDPAGTIKKYSKKG